MGKAARTNKVNDVYCAVDVFDYSNNKLCSLYDSNIDAQGQAYNIVYTIERSGWQELTFNLPFMIEAERNFRWDYIKAEYKVRLIHGSTTEWFIIHQPKKTKNGQGITNNVTCSHISSLLKTKNIYLTFDKDGDGIDTMPNLVTAALKNTGWSLGSYDVLYESDGETEKIRSLGSDGKEGSYQLISDICSLFQCYPVYHGDTQTVDIYALNTSMRPILDADGSQIELMVGRDLEGVTVEHDSSNIVTRLYVEGNYTGDEYIGIDDVNPTGLSYLLNFDYYKEIGLFTDEHQAALDRYLQLMQPCVEKIREKAAVLESEKSNLYSLWGSYRYVMKLTAFAEYVSYLSQWLMTTFNGTRDLRQLSIKDSVSRATTAGWSNSRGYDTCAYLFKSYEMGIDGQLYYVSLTPIKTDGTFMTETELDSYASYLSSSTDVLTADTDETNGKSLIFNVLTNENGTTYDTQKTELLGNLAILPQVLGVYYTTASLTSGWIKTAIQNIAGADIIDDERFGELTSLCQTSPQEITKTLYEETDMSSLSYEERQLLISRRQFADGDEIITFSGDGAYRSQNAGENGAITFANNERVAIKFITYTSGSVGALHNTIVTKQKMIADDQRTLQVAIDEGITTDITREERILAALETYFATFNGNVDLENFGSPSSTFVTTQAQLSDDTYIVVITKDLTDVDDYVEGLAASSATISALLTADSGSWGAIIEAILETGTTPETRRYNLEAEEDRAQSLYEMLLVYNNPDGYIRNVGTIDGSDYDLAAGLVRAGLDATLYAETISDSLRAEINQLTAEVEQVKWGNDEGRTERLIRGLNSYMAEALRLRVQVDLLQAEVDAAQIEQDEIEAEFILAMGDLLKDGCWSNDNYILGQELALYSDALDVIEQMSKPEVSFSLNVASLLGKYGYTDQQLEINMVARLYDPDLPINDIVAIDKIKWQIDDSSKDSIEITNKAISIGSIGFESIVSRMTQLSDQLEQKKEVYERASNITSSGQFIADKIEGQINVLSAQLQSASSNWYTDERGNMIFESSTTDSAMMITGEGFMIASERDDNGEWVWRTKHTIGSRRSNAE